MKKTIWQNIDFKVEDWKDDYKEYIEINGFKALNPEDEDEIYDYMVDTNNLYLDDERLNLDKKIDGRILILGDVGRWNGRFNGYKILDNNISSILYTDCDYCEWYSDGYNIKFKGMHHDGVNYHLYRVIREDRNIENLLNDIYDGKEISRKKLNYYTKSLHSYIAEVYGW